MPSKSHRRSKTSATPWWRSWWLNWTFRLFLVITLVPLGFIGLVATGLFGKLPDEEAIAKIQNANASQVYSSDGVLMGQFYLVNRSEITWKQIPQHLLDALIATEDVRFYEHRGLDLRSIARVLFKTLIFQKSSAGGGSTLTQQLAKNLFPRESHAFLSTLINKIKEWIIAHRLERIYSKEELLGLYLNTVPFGENVYGIEAASLHYFGISASELNAQQGAVLVGMLKANHTYNPRLFPDSSLGRRNVVLRQMAKYGYLEETATDSIAGMPLALNYSPLSSESRIAPYFLDQVRNEILQILDKLKGQGGKNYDLMSDGLRIETTIDSRMQALAEQGMQKHMQKLQQSFDEHWSKQEPWDQNPDILDAAIRASDEYKKLTRQGYDQQQILARLSTPRRIEMFHWKEGTPREMSALDSIKYNLKLLQMGFIALDPTNGNIKVWIGGIDHQFFNYDHVKSKRQVGSTFKPFVYANALEQGISPCDYIKAQQETYQEYENWSPENSSDNYEGKYSMEGAMANSVNTVTVKLIQEAGIASTIALVRSAGMESDIPEVPSIALGTPSISLLEMVRAYSIFVNEGSYCEPYSIQKIMNQDGEIIYSSKTNCKRTNLSPDKSKMIRRMLETVVNEGTAQRLRTGYNLKNDMAGKTGTTQNNADGWFMGLTPNLATGAWVGADDPRIHFRSTALGQGAITALPIFGEFMARLNKDPAFDGITRARFSPLSQDLNRELDCDPFKEDLNFWQALFGKKDQEEKKYKEKKLEEQAEEDEEVEEKKGLWKKVKGLFEKE